MYLNDWQFWDKPFSERIFSNDDKDSLDAFHHAAKYYKVTRNFPIERPRADSRPHLTWLVLGEVR